MNQKKEMNSYSFRLFVTYMLHFILQANRGTKKTTTYHKKTSHILFAGVYIQWSHCCFVNHHKTIIECIFHYKVLCTLTLSRKSYWLMRFFLFIIGKVIVYVIFNNFHIISEIWNIMSHSQCCLWGWSIAQSPHSIIV